MSIKFKSMIFQLVCFEKVVRTETHLLTRRNDFAEHENRVRRVESVIEVQ